MAVSFKPIRPLLQTGVSTASRWFSYIGLGIGVLLLLCSVQMYINIQQMLTTGSVRRDGYDFISITKTVTDETVGTAEKNLFHQQDIDELKALPFIEDAAPLLANDFRVKLSAGGILSTDLFLETLENAFIDTVPASFTWQEGQMHVPIIISSDFLEIYNVFAPGQDLPQFSKEAVGSIAVQITCYGNGLEQTFTGKVAALSDRVNSVLVPKAFLEWANKTFGRQKEIEAGRIFLKTKDANNPDLIRYLQEKNYTVNRDKTLLGRNKAVIQGIFSGLGVFGLLVVILALLLFSFYLQLVIARSKDSLQLLLTLGYSPTWLSRNVSKRFTPIYILIVLSALAMTQIVQWLFHRFAMFNRPELNTLVHWSILATAVVLVVLSVFTNYRLVKKLLNKLY